MLLFNKLTKNCIYKKSIQKSTSTTRFTSRLIKELDKRHFTLKLRPYQEECIEVCLEKFKNGKIRRQVVSLPVGSGKTVIFSNLIKRIEPPFKEAKKVLVIAHREELIDQARSQISKVSPDLIVDVDKGENEAAFDADIIVGSVQTLGREDTL
ncbi:16800_t:CDS:2, partial [Entrophospora sp. SA101]